MRASARSWWELSPSTSLQWRNRNGDNVGNQSYVYMAAPWTLGQQDPTYRPSARAYATLLPCYNGKYCLFGGYGVGPSTAQRGALGDVWK